MREKNSEMKGQTDNRQHKKSNRPGNPIPGRMSAREADKNSPAQRAE